VLLASKNAQLRRPVRQRQNQTLDVRNPCEQFRFDGLEVLRRLRADDRTKRLPVVILTTSNENKDVIDSYDLGANSFIRKPVDFAQFLDAARQLGLYWLVLNEPPRQMGGIGERRPRTQIAENVDDEPYLAAEP
jgi:CheY-like chemotaxis protein